MDNAGFISSTVMMSGGLRLHMAMTCKVLCHVTYPILCLAISRWVTLQRPREYLRTKTPAQLELHPWRQASCSSRCQQRSLPRNHHRKSARPAQLACSAAANASRKKQLKASTPWSLDLQSCAQNLWLEPHTLPKSSTKA